MLNNIFSNFSHDQYIISSSLFLIWAALTYLILFFASIRIFQNPLLKFGDTFFFIGGILIFIGIIFLELITNHLGVYINSLQDESQKFLTDNVTLTPAELEVYKMLLDKIIDITNQRQNYYEKIILLVSGGVGGGLITQGFIEKHKSNNSTTPIKIKKLKRNNLKPERRN